MVALRPLTLKRYPETDQLLFPIKDSGSRKIESPKKKLIENLYTDFANTKFNQRQSINKPVS